MRYVLRNTLTRTSLAGASYALLALALVFVFVVGGVDANGLEDTIGP